VAKDETILEMVGDYLRELSVLVLVFFPLELSKGDPFSLNRPLMRQVAWFSVGTFGLGVLFAKWVKMGSFFLRAYRALRREFGGGNNER
jgi:hypothetical protein